jgi:hypothetical protein
MDELNKIEYKNINILTTKQIAEAYCTETKTISKNFERNKEKYILGKHYYLLESAELREFKANRQIDDLQENTHQNSTYGQKRVFYFIYCLAEIRHSLRKLD